MKNKKGPFLKLGSKWTVINNNIFLMKQVILCNLFYEIKTKFKENNEFSTLAMADSFPEHEFPFSSISYKLSSNLFNRNY